MENKDIIKNSNVLGCVAGYDINKMQTGDDSTYIGYPANKDSNLKLEIALDAILLDIAIDVQDAVLKSCSRANVDDYQLDIINEGSSEVFELNKNKYIEKIKK